MRPCNKSCEAQELLITRAGRTKAALPVPPVTQRAVPAAPRQPARSRVTQFGCTAWKATKNHIVPLYPSPGSRLVVERRLRGCCLLAGSIGFPYVKLLHASCCFINLICGW